MTEFTHSSIPIVIEQLPLIQIVEQDDILLRHSKEGEWFRILNSFPWMEYREAAALYYDALYDFNQSDDNDARVSDGGEQIESKKEAALRLLSARPTVNKNAPVLYEQEYRSPPVRKVSPLSLAPGLVPCRDGGKKPKCFFALFKSFIGATLIGFPSEPESVHLLLTSNLSFARVCGFIPKSGSDPYWQKHVPSLRKLEQFDQIMREYGIWNKIKTDEVIDNIKKGVVQKENVLIGDTTHYHAYSEFETVTYKGETGEDCKKSQSKVTKKCQCSDKTNCLHKWELSDDGAGTIVKKHNKYIWGHKASILGLPLQGIPLDAAAVADAATFDGETFFPHVERLFNNIPEVKSWIDTVLYDSACDNGRLKEKFCEELKIELKTSLNPRRRRTVTEGLPMGMEKLTPFGIMTCTSGFEMDFKGARYDAEKFIFQAPKDKNGECVCSSCQHKPVCSPLSSKGRVVTISFDMLPHIDAKDAPMAKRYKAMMTRRPSIERIIKRLKCDLGDDRLTKRGNEAFQAYLDKTMIAFHILLRN